jgi:hypothetical protein
MFELTKGGVTKEAYAKFTYLVRKTADGVKIITHNSGLTPKGVVVPALQLSTKEVDEFIQTWAATAQARDVEKMTSLYDPEMGRLLGTVDEAVNVRRDNLADIKEYFNGFLGGNDGVKPNFPAFDEKDVIFLSDGTASYSGYYMFELTKGGITKEAYAKFTYLVRKTADGVKIITHNSGLTPTGVVMPDGAPTESSTGVVVLSPMDRRRREKNAAAASSAGGFENPFENGCNQQ